MNRQLAVGMGISFLLVLGALLGIGISALVTKIEASHVGGSIGRWTFDEESGTTAFDSAGHGNHGTLQDMSDANRVEGKLGLALDFTSPMTFVSVPHSDSLDIATNEMTVTAWVKFRSFVGCDPVNDDPAIVEKDGNSFMLGVNGRCNNRPRFRLTTTSGTVTLQSPTLSAGIWYHLAGVYDGSTMFLYQNGVVVASAPQSGNVDIPSDDLLIGHRTQFNSFIDGLIDEVRMFDRSLSGTEITGLFLAGTDEAGWRLRGNFGTTAGPSFLGTTDNEPLELHVNSERVLRIEANSSPNLIGGFSGNNVDPGAVGATIAGGGATGKLNTVTGGDYGTVSGGLNNTASGIHATVGGGAGNTAGGAGGSAGTVGGGNGNTASGTFATVGGGVVNEATRFAATVGGGDDNIASNTESTIGGGHSNVASGVSATVGGGNGNTASGGNATVSGGAVNTAGGMEATVGGGSHNSAIADFATIAGGGPSFGITTGNRVTDNHGTVGGGGNNQAGDGDEITTNATFATASGGESNEAKGSYSTVGGGRSNFATGESATVGGGFINSASGEHSTVGGGTDNIASAFSTVGGGGDNQALGSGATIGGGASNDAVDDGATVGGGASNIAGSFDGDPTNATYATVSGGQLNKAFGAWSTVPGGEDNLAWGDYSFAAGRRANIDPAHDGAFLFADSNDFEFHSAAANEFAARATGGTRFVSAIDGSGNPTAGVQLPSGGGAWLAISDRAAKANFTLVDGRDILERLIAIPIETWNYDTQDPSIRHIGPMAEDFFNAFGVGEDDRHISTLDPDGVALAAIQGLHQLVQEKDLKITELEARLTSVEQAIGTDTDSAPTRRLSGMSVIWLFAGAMLMIILMIGLRYNRSRARRRSAI